MAARKFNHDVRVGHSPVHFGSDQVLLQLRILGEDDVAVSGSRLYVHDQATRDDDGRTRGSVERKDHRICFAGALVWRGVGRAVDWVFVTN